MIDIARTVDWPAFAAVLTAAYLIPGPDFLVILNNSTARVRAGISAAFGAQTGLTVHMGLATLGLSALLTGMPALLTIIQIAGAVYLVALGVQLTRSHPDSPVAQGRACRANSSGPVGSAFRQGLLTNLLNPKAIIFFASVLPQFVTPGGDVRAQVLFLGVVDVLAGFVPWAAVVTTGSALATWLTRDGHRRQWNRVSGGLLTLVALWLFVAALVSAFEK